jgi:outer membrane receptor protein involved in Fe transport
LLPAAVDGSPCTNLGVYNYSTGSVNPVHAKGNGGTYRFNATWKPSKDLMLYATWSRGFRPGGINRRADVANYEPDYLTNYELGFKTTLADGLIRLNGAIYQQDWKRFQFAYLGANSFTKSQRPQCPYPRRRYRRRGWSRSAHVDDGCGLCRREDATEPLLDDPTFTLSGCGEQLVSAPKGTRLPVTPQWKGAARCGIRCPWARQGLWPGQRNLPEFGGVGPADGDL